MKMTAYKILAALLAGFLIGALTLMNTGRAKADEGDRPLSTCRSIAHRANFVPTGEETVDSIKRLGGNIWLDTDAALTANPNYLVAMHDARTGRISAGGGNNVTPEESTLAELRAIPLIWDDVRIATVRETIAAAKSTGAKMLIDIKRWGTYSDRWLDGGFQVLRDEIVNAEMTPNVYVLGVGPDREAFHALYPGIKLGIRTYADDPHPMTADWIVDRVGTNGFVGLMPQDRRPGLVSQLKALGVQVGTTHINADDVAERQAAWDAGINIIGSYAKQGCAGLKP